MFRILVNQDINIKPVIGLLHFNYIPITWTSLLKGGKLTYDGGAAYNNIESKLIEQAIHAPTVLDISHISRSNTGRHNIAELLDIYHSCSGHNSQVGFCSLWPTPTKAFTTKQIVESIEGTFKQNRYGQPNILKLLQFITCWAHPYTAAWDEWEELLHTSFNKASKFYKPVYVDMTLSYHASSKVLSGKLIEPLRLETAIRQVYSAGFDGVILRHNKMIDVEYCEVILSALNQINE